MPEVHPRLIAFYLPQFHPVPENDEWWGKGFTEWTNVAKARPLFKGHYQPHIPADLGFYDLRLPESRQAQADLAREAGVEGFCYWYLWSAGRRLLERPFDEVLALGEPDLPFCLGWDNETWTGVWLNAADRILREQLYPGEEDDIAHFNTVLLPAFSDKRYMTVEGKPLLVIYRPADVPQVSIALFRKLAADAGFKGLFLLGIIKNKEEGLIIQQNGFDACTISKVSGRGVIKNPLKNVLLKVIGEKRASNFYQKLTRKPFFVFDHREAKPFFEKPDGVAIEYYPSIMPNFDNTPRAGIYGHVYEHSSPDVCQEHLHQAIERIRDFEPDHQIIIIKSWNEWAEGNYLEPERRFGHGYLQAIRSELNNLARDEARD